MSTSPRRLGKYELQERLGRGGMGEVLKAFDTQLQRYVAIKLLHADLQTDTSFTARFQREAQVIASLHHPNIVQLYDFQVSPPSEAENAICYMVMDYVEGQTLSQYIRGTSRVGKYPSAADIVQLFAPISLAIDYAHQKGMIHRDIKPSNILLDQRNTARNPMGEPILTDFGIAKLLGAPAVTLIGLWLGTPYYTSPEQAKGAPGNERSDLYSLGVILYEICTGILPFQGDTPTAILMQHINATPTLPNCINPNIPPALTMVIMRSLAKDPAARFPTASALAIALAEALNRPIPEGLRPALPLINVAGEPNYQGPMQPALPPDVSASLAPTKLMGSSAPFGTPVSGGPGTVMAGNSSDSSPMMFLPRNPLSVSSPSTPMPDGANYAMVQEYVRGENLEERLNHLGQPLQERDVLIYVSQVLSSLEDMAQQTPPVMHGDIRPATILIGNKDRRAHLIGGLSAAPWKQISATLPGYVPLEQLQGNVDPRSDLYALAATMHHLLTNRNPRDYPPFAYPLASTLTPRVSWEVERLLVRALTNDISQRYQSAMEMKRDIDDILLRLYGTSSDTGGYAPGMSGSMGAVGGMEGKSATSPSPIAKVTRRIQSWLNPSDEASSQPLGMQQQMPLISPAITPLPGPSISQQGVYAAPPRPLQQRKGRRRWAIVFVAVLLLLILGGILYPLLFLHGGSHNKTTIQSGLGIGVTKAPDGEYIGLSDGTFAFDTARPDGDLKLQAAAKLKTGDVGSAVSLWQSAIAMETNDAEALIYLEDQKVLASGSPYITLVVATMLTGDNAYLGRNNLQGAYVAQKEYNDGFKLPGAMLVRLLLANSGSASPDSKLYAKSVAQQIVQAAQADRTIVGVMGWPFSSRVLNAVGILGIAHIPMVSESATSVLLNRISPYFFRVVPPDTAQATLGAKFVEQTLHAKAAALFLDPTDVYSKSLADAFTQTFTADGNRIVVTEQYTETQPANLPDRLHDALSHNPDLIYFSGFSPDASVIVANLPTAGPFANLIVMGGDGLNEQYSETARPNLGRVRFTTFAYPDEWKILGLTAQEPAFFREYPQYFNPGGQSHSSPYGFTRPANDAMLAYDATVVLLEGGRIAFTKAGNKFTSEDLRQGLTTITGAQALQGVTGQIALGPDGNPIDKEVIVYSVTQDQHFQMVGWQGRFLKGA